MNKIRAALVGNPNVGKTTFINALAGSNLKVGNWAGVTVTKKEAIIFYKDREIYLVDLPGIYSLSYNSEDEKVSFDYLLSGDYDVIINVVESSNLERALILTTELLEFKKPILIVLNMWDEAQKRGIFIDTKVLEDFLNVKSVISSAVKGVNKEEVLEKIISLKEENILPRSFKFSQDVEECIKEISNKIITINSNIQKRVLAILSLSGAHEFVSIKDCKEKLLEDPSELIIRERFSFVHFIYEKALKKKLKIDQVELTDKIDNIALHPIFGIFLFFLIFYFVFKIAFDLSTPITNWFSDFLTVFLPKVFSFYLNKLNIPPILIDFINNGVLRGVGFVVSFVPIIGILFLIINFLEMSGYLPRLPFLIDRFFSFLGIDARGVLPLMLSFGCNVPAIMALKTIEDKKSRLILGAMIPFVSCPARFIVFSFFASIFFNNPAPIIVSLYAFGIVVAILTAIVLNKALFKGKQIPLLIELPPYRIPPIKVLYKLVMYELKSFLKRAGTVIFLCAIVVWFLVKVPFGAPPEKSIVGYMGKGLSYVFSPIGISDWRASASLVPAFLAREIIISSMGTIYSESFGSKNSESFDLKKESMEELKSLEDSLIITGKSLFSFGFSNLFSGEEYQSSLKDEIKRSFTRVSAISFMIFVLLYTSCVATVAILKNVFGTKYATLFLLYSFLVAYLFSFLFYNLYNILF